MAIEDFAAAVAQLQHSASAKRRSAAKLLRKSRATEAGPALLAALQAEVLDTRTWETQYQLIMAIGECAFVPATAFLRELASRRIEATAVYVALGDALVRLAGSTDDRGKVALGLASFGNLDLADGACQALAMLRLVPRTEVIESIIAHADRTDLHEVQGSNRRFWVAAACPGWLDKSACVRPFLMTCAGSQNQQVQRAAEAALQGKYLKWSPL